MPERPACAAAEDKQYFSWRGKVAKELFFI
jgi:hypothetical protein